MAGISSCGTISGKSKSWISFSIRCWFCKLCCIFNCFILNILMCSSYYLIAIFTGSVSLPLSRRILSSFSILNVLLRFIILYFLKIYWKSLRFLHHLSEFHFFQELRFSGFLEICFQKEKGISFSRTVCYQSYVQIFKILFLLLM